MEHQTVDAQPIEINDPLQPLRRMCADAALMLLERLGTIDPRSDRAQTYRTTIADLINDITHSGR